MLISLEPDLISQFGQHSKVTCTFILGNKNFHSMSTLNSMGANETPINIAI